MRIHCILSQSLALFVTVAIGNVPAAVAEDSTTTISLKPVPTGVVELINVLNNRGSVIERADGALMHVNGETYQLSTDGGRTWGDDQPLGSPFGALGAIRLQSGALAIYGGDTDKASYFSSSADEGKTWSEPALVADYPDVRPMFGSMIQLASGRLLLTGYWHGLYSWEKIEGEMRSVHPDLEYLDVSSYGSWRGQRYQVEGHGHAPEIGICVVYRSDDQGQTWQKHPGGLIGWFDAEGIPNGNGGMTSCFEPVITETKEGNVLFMARSVVGRLVQSFSTDGGEHFYAIKPSSLPSSESPAILATLPSGDLLIVWNQISREEIRRGYRRGRLSAAISADGGHSWGNFKTLELSEGLEDSDRIPPEFPVSPVRARQWVGALPDRWAYFHYPNVNVIGDNVILRYSRGSPWLGVAEQNLKTQEYVLRIYPVEWFYE